MFEKLKGHIWFDGRVIPCEQATIHVVTHGLHYATSVFEGIRSYGGKIFKGREHYERLHRSANLLGFEVPFSVEEMLSATESLIQQGGYQDTYIRPLVWCGTRSMMIANHDMDIHAAIALWEWTTVVPESYFTKGIKMNISPWRRADPRTAPVQSKAAGLYMTSSLSKSASEKAGFDDALMLDYQGNVAEGTVSNIFFTRNDKLYTPKAETFLNGITRLTILEIAKELHIEVVEEVITLEDLGSMEEAFLTGTAVEIRPIASIEGFDQTWHFIPGRLTSRIREVFTKMTGGA